MTFVTYANLPCRDAKNRLLWSDETALLAQHELERLA